MRYYSIVQSVDLSDMPTSSFNFSLLRLDPVTKKIKISEHIILFTTCVCNESAKTVFLIQTVMSDPCNELYSHGLTCKFTYVKDLF